MSTKYINDSAIFINHCSSRQVDLFRNSKVRIPSIEFAIQRVKDRVRLGGHHIPEAVIRRRFYLGIRNLFGLYRPLLTTWTL